MSANKQSPNMNQGLASTAELLREKFNIERRLQAINEALDMVFEGSAPAATNGHTAANGLPRLSRWDSK